MNMKTIINIGIVASLLFTACEYDNFAEPTSSLKGRIVYEGEPVGVRTNGPILQIWEDGHELRTPLNVHIAHDGTFSATLFDGQYKLIRMGNSPWLQNVTDTIVVDVRGTTQIDVPVTPYFTLSNTSIQHVSGNINADFTLNQIVETSRLENVNLYLGRHFLVDDIYHDLKIEVNADDITVDGTNSISAAIPDGLKNQGHIFVRLGVRSSSSGELYYSQIQKIDL